MSVRTAVITCVLGVGLALAGCGGSEDPSPEAGSPSPPRPPTIAGKLLVLVDQELKVITQGPDGSPAMTPFDVKQSDDFDYQVTFDRALFVYRNGPVVTARNLSDGGERRLAGDAAARSACLRVSPDGKRVSYRRADDLAVVDLNGAVTVLDKVKKATYSFGANKTSARSELGCAEWLDATHLAFQRVKAMPEATQVRPGALGAEIKADTTTVAVLGGGSPKLLDTSGMWNPTASCGNRMAINPGNTGEPLRFRDGWTDGDLTKPNALTGPDLALAGTTAGTHRVFFVPGSCDALLYTDDDRTIRSIDPALRKIGTRPLVTMPTVGEVNLYDNPPMWQPGQGAQVLTTIVNKKLVVVDLRAGTAAELPVDGLTSISYLVAWLP